MPSLALCVFTKESSSTTAHNASPDSSNIRADTWVRARRPNGFTGPDCGGADAYWNSTRYVFECTVCHKPTSTPSGTIMHRSKLPLQNWFWAADIMATHPPGMSAKPLYRYLGMTCDETAWSLLQRVRRAMVNESRAVLRGTVEADEPLIGGPAKGKTIVGLQGSEQIPGAWTSRSVVVQGGPLSGRTRIK